MKVPYDENDPFHAEMNILFCVLCDRCDNTVDMWDFGDGSEELFLPACAEAAEFAKASGWIWLGDQFRCGECVARAE